jgi:uncharacterized alkaline shock family protein YloU
VPAAIPPGRSFVTKRAVVDVVRSATLGSYGVTGFADHDLPTRIARWLRLEPRGIRVRLAPRLEIDLWLAVAWGLPVAEVARQVDSAVRYALRRALQRDPDALVIHVNRLRVLPATAPSAGSAAAPTGAATRAVVPAGVASDGMPSDDGADTEPADSAADRPDGVAAAAHPSIPDPTAIH